MKRFGAGRTGAGASALRWAASLFMSAALMTALVVGTFGVEKASREEQLRSLKDSVTRAAVHCYAVEGAYPASIAELEQRYGLVYDHERFMVDYNCFASNLMPDITVLAIK